MIQVLPADERTIAKVMKLSVDLRQEDDDEPHVSVAMMAQTIRQNGYSIIPPRNKHWPLG